MSDARDIYELRAELERVRQLFDSLMYARQAILHSKTRQELFDKLCTIAVEQGGFRLAFVGWIDERTKQVAPVAKFGNHTAFLDAAPMFADARPRGMGPTGQSIRSEKPYICNDYFNDPATEPWHASAAEHGFRASGTFPIRLGGKVAGVFVLYAGEVGYFRDREIHQLEQVSNDLSFALDNLLREERRVKAEEGARRLAAIVESSLDAIISEDLDGTILSWNIGAEQMYGYRADEAIGKPVLMLVPEDKRQETEELLVQIRSGRSFTGVETERIHKCGLRFPVSITLSPVRDAEGNIVGVSKIAHDISEQMASVAAVRESTGLLQVLIREAPAGLAMFDSEMRMLACSDRWRADRCLTNIEVVGWTHAELDPAIPDRWKQEERRALGGETIVSPQDFYKRHDGQIRWLSRTLRPWMTGTGEIGGIVILSEDITERKLAEDARRRSEEFLRIFIEDAPVALAMFDRELRYLGSNRYWREEGGLGDLPLIGRHRYEVNPSFPEHWKQADQRALAGEVIELDEEEFVRHDGTTIWLRWEDRPWRDANGDIGGIIVFSENITDRKQAQLALAEESARTRLLFEKAFDSMFLLDEEFRVVEANERFAALLGRPLKDVYGLHPWDWDPDRPSLDTGMDIGAHVSSEPLSFEARVRSLDGSVRDVVFSTTPTEWHGRKLIYNIMHDITARKQREAARREAEQQLRLVIDSLDEGLFVVNMRGELLSWNPAARRILGIPEEGFEHVALAQYPEFITVFAEDGSVLPPEQWPLVRALCGERIENEVRLTRSKFLKEDRMISYSGSTAEIGDGKQFAFLRCQDVTARRQAEKKPRGSKA